MMWYLNLKVKVKDSIQFIIAYVDSYQMKEQLLFSDMSNQANINLDFWNIVWITVFILIEHKQKE